jgi:sugar O-acyltransferase (sialic acid O-acetyltransferase NeuD family)
MKDLIIVGAGGFGRDLYYIIIDSIGYNIDFKILGYIDDNLEVMNGFSDYPKLLGKISDHEILENQIFICSIGNIGLKNFISSSLISKGAIFINIIHSTARIAKSSSLGTGIIIGPLVSIGANSKIGDHCILQTGVIVGHDVIIGDYSRIDNYSILVAGVILQKFCTIHSNSVINSKILINEKATVGACSFVIKNVHAGTTVFGNPAKLLL